MQQEGALRQIRECRIWGSAARFQNNAVSCRDEK